MFKTVCNKGLDFMRRWYICHFKIYAKNIKKKYAHIVRIKMQMIVKYLKQMME
jgi:hypothetical protein